MCRVGQSRMDWDEVHPYFCKVSRSEHPITMFDGPDWKPILLQELFELFVPPSSNVTLYAESDPNAAHPMNLFPAYADY